VSFPLYLHKRVLDECLPVVDQDGQALLGDLDVGGPGNRELDRHNLEKRPRTIGVEIERFENPRIRPKPRPGSASNVQVLRSSSKRI
jgi:hypothetical protein